MAQKNMKKKLFFLAILLCVSSCGNNQSDLTTDGNNTPTTSSELTPTTSEVVDTTPEVTTQQTTTHIHTFEDTLTYDETHHWYAATCGHDDAITKTKHTYEKVVTKPTYEEKGYTTYSCKDCEYSYRGDEKDVLKHNYSTQLTYDEHTHWYPCIDKGYEHLKKDEKSHTYKEVVTKPTYEEKGYTTYTCSVCGYSYKGNEKDALKHNYSTQLTYDEHTHWYPCTDAGYEQLKKDEKPHTFESIVTPSTYEEKGYTTHTCLACGYSYVDNETELLRHTITYNLNGGTNSSSNPSSFTVEDEFYLRSATKEGYAFLGWVDKNGNIVTEIKKGTNYDIELTAQWSSYLFEISNNVLTGFDKTVMAPEIRIPSGVTKIGTSAFEGSEYLYAITIPSSVTSMETDAFEDCYNLSYVFYEGTLEQWCNISFGYITATPMFYGEHFFMLDQNNEWYEVTDIVIPNSVTSIGNYQFSDFDCLESVTISKNVTSINYFGFRNCISLETITFETDSKLTTIGESAFLNCESLKSIDIPNKVTTIKISAFEECLALESITIPTSVNTIERSAFNKCESLVSVVIPSSVTIIDEFLFSGCKSLISITIPTSIKTIGQYAFSNCTSLKLVDVPSSVTTIGQYAFYNCTSLFSIKIPSSVTTIGFYTFEGCESLIIYCQASSKPRGWDDDWNYDDCLVYWGKAKKDILEQDGVQYIVVSGKAIVSGCLDNSSEVNISSSVNINNTNYSVTSIGALAFANHKTIASVSIPNTITSLGEEAFYYSSVQTINFEDGSKLTTIGDSMFEGCDQLTDINLPSSITSIGNDAFSFCDSLVTIKIPNKVTKIGEGAFEYCFELVSIVIPSSVTTIGKSAFNLCWELTIYCEATSKPSGWDTNWNSYNCSVYWAGQWKYDENNKPTPLK